MEIISIQQIVKAVYDNPNVEASELGLSDESLLRVKKSDAFQLLHKELESNNVRSHD